MRNESAVSLRKTLETTNEHLRALAELGEPLDSSDSLLIFESSKDSIVSLKSKGCWLIRELNS